MKKFLKKFLCVSLVTFMLLAVFGVVIKNSDEDKTIANAAGAKYVVKIDYAVGAFRVDELRFVYDGIDVQYRYQDEYLEGEWVYQLVVPTGVTSTITDGASHSTSGADATTYYFYKDEASVLEGTFSSINGIYSLPDVVPVDEGTKISFVVNAKSSSTFANFYFNKISYSTALQPDNFPIVTPVVETDGTITLSGIYNEHTQLYEKEVNSRLFAYNFDPSTGFKFEIGAVTSSLEIDFSSTNKSYPILITGPASTDGSMDVDYTEYISHSNLASAVFTPKSGKIIKQIDLYLGKKEEANKLFTLYGGMSDERAGEPVLDYYFNSDFALDTATTPIAVYGNFALAIESHIESSYSFVFKSPSDTGGNYSQLVMTGDPLSDNESYVINLYQSGRVKVYTYKATAGLIFDVTTQSYAQVNLKFVNNGDTIESADASAKALSTLVVNGTVYENSAEVDGPKIPRSVFVIGHSGTIEVQATIDLINYRYHEQMGTDDIEGAVFTTTIEGGVYNIYTEEKDTYFLEIKLLKPDGNTYYMDSATEIYITTNGSFDGVDPDTFSDNGYGKISSLTEEDTIKFKIKVPPYRMVKAPDDSVFVLEYESTDMVITQNTTLVFTVYDFSIEKPVYCGDDVIGSVKITLMSYISAGPMAGYSVLFKGTDESEYSALNISHPSRYGYDFLNLRVMGTGEPTDLLEEYFDSTYIINQTDYDLHEYLASVVFGAGNKEDGVWLEAIFSPKLVSLRIKYPEGTNYNGRIYFGSDELYLDGELEVIETGKYFAGLRYTCLDGTTGEVYRNQTDVPVLLTEGHFEGWYYYKLTNNWLCAENLVPIEVLTDFATYELTVVFTHSGGSADILTGNIKYGEEFSIEDLNEVFDWPTYPGVGTFNHIGWAIEDTDDYVVSDSCDYVLGRSITYLWPQNVRLVPVFSANIVVVSLYDRTEHGVQFIYSTTVSAGEEVDVSKLLYVNDSWIVLNQYGYVFEGFSCSGNLALDYVAEPTYYVALEDGNSDIFVNDGVLRWNASSNLVFESVYTEIAFKILLDVQNQEYAEPSNWTSNFGTWVELPGNQFLLDGFSIGDTLELGGFAPKSEDAFIALVQFGYEDNATTEFLDPEFVAVCDANGVVTGLNSGTRFNLEDFSIALVVNELINEETRAHTIRIKIEYLPITYIISFTANIIDETGAVVFEDLAETVYYKFSKENASIDRADYWNVCDETGEVILGWGWQEITTPNSGLVFAKNSLGGISGIRFNAPNGKTYSFKFWKDIMNGFTLDASSVLTANYNFTSVFSDVFDVTINYHVYNSISSTYEINSVEGYFAYYHDDGAGGMELSIGETETANSYEIYLIGGSLYYICAWSMNQPEGLCTTIGAGDKGLAEAYQVEYSIEAQIINYYAVYSEYKFSLDEELAPTYKATVTVSIPNDPNGNSYSNADVKFVKVLKVQFNSDVYLKYSTVDKLNAILSSVSIIGTSTLPAEGNVLIEPVVESDYYVFAVVQRKVDGMNVAAFYVAMQLSINKD